MHDSMELILFNKDIKNEADLNDLKLFSSSDNDFTNSMNHIDMNNLGEKKNTSKRYDTINISSSLLENDISENFNFKNILSN
jgi:hypothetical protein